MSIKRYSATKDNTISSAFKVNLSDKAVTSNMGSSDILEVFSIFGQASSSSLEQSRVLVAFAIDEIHSDRQAGIIPESGSVKFKIKMFNAEHNQTVPEGITLTAIPLVKEWSEGSGLDMEGYLDIGPSSWNSASSGVAWTTTGGDFLTSSYIASSPVPMKYSQLLSSGTEDVEIDATSIIEQMLVNEAGNSTPSSGSITFNQDNLPTSGTKFKIYGHDGDYRIFQFANTSGSSGKTIFVQLGTTVAEHASQLVNSVNANLASTVAATATTASTGKATATLMVDSSAFSTLDLDLINADGTTHTITAAALGGGNPSTATQINTSVIGNANDAATQLKASLDAAVTGGNLKMTVSAITNNTSGNPRVITLKQNTAGPTGAKAIAGTLISGNKIILNNTGSSVQGSASFIDPELKVALTQRTGTFYGNTIISSSVASSVAVVSNFAGGRGALNYGFLVKLSEEQEDGSLSRSYYTKKFFARSSHHTMERPVIEVQWDSSIKDDRGNIIKSSSMAPAADNLNNIYLYNKQRSGMVDIPSTASNLLVKFVPNLGEVRVTASGPDVSVENYVTASRHSSGIYKASFAYSGDETKLYDIWLSDTRLAQGTFTYTGTVADLNNGVNFTIVDTDGVSHVYTFDTSGDSHTVSGQNSTIGVQTAKSGTDTGVIATQVNAAINASTFFTSTVSGSVVTIKQKSPGTDGNRTSAQSAGNVGYTVTNLAIPASSPYTTLMTGSGFTITPGGSDNYYEIPQYLTNITNLKSSYKKDEQATFRVYTRNKNWQPNIYTVASNTAPVNIIRDAYYKITRPADNMIILDYSTGSTPSYSSLSYDVSGSYFDLDMSILEPNYLYEIAFLYKDGLDYVEQKEKFKFRVDP